MTFRIASLRQKAYVGVLSRVQGFSSRLFTYVLTKRLPDLVALTKES